MNFRTVALLLSLPCVGCAAASLRAPDPAGESRLPTVAEKTTGMPRRAGLWDLYFDRAGGRLLVALPAADSKGHLDEVLYVEGLRTGLGSNPVGLDRGQLGESRIIQVRRVGRRVLFVQPNLAYRARTANPRERRAVEDSFARSVLWSTAVIAEDERAILIDLTNLVIQDAHGVAARLANTEQGKFRLDKERSVVEFDACFAFPDNLELEALLTFAGEAPGDEVRSTSPDPGAVSLVQHHSFVRLPGPGYRPRRFDPRLGSFAIDFRDYAAPLDAPIDQRWIVRHRLEKVDPAVPRSPVKEPIVYYVDPGTPEPIRSALVDGARWWQEAFDRAGFVDAYRVEMLPEGAHPLDIRYNVIQWVHRETRGWSYGGGVVDPRTGEMIKGHVTLGSLRVRQDRLLFEGLGGTAKTGSGEPDDPIQLALARIRQLAAHEVGHTLGLAHNFAASSYLGRASVMDYPAPLVDVRADGELDVTNAYGVGVGAWDLHAIRYAYTQFPPGADEDQELARIVREGLEAGYVMASDEAARPRGSARPLASLWDNGSDAVAALERTMRVRAAALGAFGEDRIAEGQPLARLEEVFATVYLHHRFQVEATAKVVGGLAYGTAVRGAGEGTVRPLPAEQQRVALRAVLQTVEPRALDIPETTLRLLHPRPFGYPRHRELFHSGTHPAFDALGAAATAAHHSLRALLEPFRVARLVDQHRRDPSLPGYLEVLDTLERALFGQTSRTPRRRRIREVVQRVAVDRAVHLAAEGTRSTTVGAQTEHWLTGLRTRLAGARGVDEEARAHLAVLQRDLTRYLEERRWNGSTGPRPAAAPPGSPIGRPGNPHGRHGCAAPAFLPLSLRAGALRAPEGADSSGTVPAW